MTRGFGVYFDPMKTTSGQRFFGDLCAALGAEAVPLKLRPKAVLFNVSAPLGELARAKLRGQRIVLRIDGMYCDRLSPAFISRFSFPLRGLFKLGVAWPKLHDGLAFLANLLDENYGSFARMLLADHIVYQSSFSQELHAGLFSWKPSAVIVNGSVDCSSERPGRRRHAGDHEIRLVTVYDDWKPAKRIHDLLAFVAWATDVKGIPLCLTVLGYTGNVPGCSPRETRAMLESSQVVRTIPRFTRYDGVAREALFDSAVYVTMTHRDPCPNAVVEAMAHGLPVVAVDSGGLRDIVGDAGALVPLDGPREARYSSYRFECGFPPVNFERFLAAITTVVDRIDHFESSVQARFASSLEMKAVAEQYAKVLREVAML